ncbi:MAG: hypothetical protein Q7R72_00365 [bacterium]|nr:hypothetical protein [bacterium]
MKNYIQSKYDSKYKFAPKKPVKTFRDLDIYQRTLECSVIVVKNIRPKLVILKYPFLEGFINCAMTVPLSIGESHSIRFGDFVAGIALIEKAMSGCNKMIIYLEHIKGMYGSKLDTSLIDDVINRYADSRTKTFHLELSWKKWNGANRVDNPANKVRL